MLHFLRWLYGDTRKRPKIINSPYAKTWIYSTIRQPPGFYSDYGVPFSGKKGDPYHLRGRGYHLKAPTSSLKAPMLTLLVRKSKQKAPTFTLLVRKSEQKAPTFTLLVRKSEQKAPTFTLLGSRPYLRIQRRSFWVELRDCLKLIFSIQTGIPLLFLFLVFLRKMSN